MTSLSLIKDRKHGACFNNADGLYKIFGVRNQTEKDKYEYLKEHGKE